jgi:hypothetical protein
MYPRITKAMLENLDACEDQVVLFDETFPDGVDAPASDEDVDALLARLDGVGLDIGWAASKLLSESAWEVYDETVAPAWEVYDETVEPAKKVYDETVASAKKAYAETVASAKKAYAETVASAKKVYDETVAPAKKVYVEAIASAKKVRDEARTRAFIQAWRTDCAKENA